jgi:hypothetical protein
MCLTPGGDSKPRALVMCDIPMDLERRFERRWAARFSGPAKDHRLEEQHQQVTVPDESKTRQRGTGRLASTDLSPRPQSAHCV